MIHKSECSDCDLKATCDLEVDADLLERYWITTIVPNNGSLHMFAAAYSQHDPNTLVELPLDGLCFSFLASLPQTSVELWEYGRASCITDISNAVNFFTTFRAHANN